MPQLALTTSTLAAIAGRCGWCLDGTATQLLYTVPTCASCAAVVPKGRVLAWMRAVHARKEGLR